MLQNNEHHVFCKMVLNKISIFKAIAQEYVMERWPDEPLWTLMYEDFGIRTVEHFKELSIEQRNELFNLIENALNSNDLLFKNTIVAGFIEGLVYALDKEPVLWNDVDIFFLPTTKEVIAKYTSRVKGVRFIDFTPPTNPF